MASGSPQLSRDYGLVAIMPLLLMATEHTPLHIIQERILVYCQAGMMEKVT